MPISNYNELYAGESCECGHRFEEHRGIAECTVHGCDCPQFHRVESTNIHLHVCEVCGRTYECGHKKCVRSGEVSDGVCNVCSKNITDNYPGDLIPYLFGVTGDNARSMIIAKKLAIDVKNAGVNVKQLFDFWLLHH